MSSEKPQITILYTEDDVTTRRLVSSMLQAQRYRVIQGENGTQGLELFRKHLPDIVLTDLKMPIMSGLEMARAIRTGNEAPDTQVIVMTAFSDTEYLLDAIDVGVNQYVLKPIEFTKLQKAISNCSKAIELQRCLHKQAEHIRMLTNAIEHSPSMVMVTDIHGRIEYVNQKFSEVTGYTAEEAIGKNPRILKSGLTPQSVYSDLWSTILAGSEWHGELQNRTKSHELFWESSSISPMLGSDGTISKFINSGRDITEQRKLEQELLKIRKLEGVALLAGGMAHDFNNLLQMILGYISLAKLETKQSSKAHKLLDMAEKNTWQASELGQRLLTFAGNGMSKREVTTISDVIAATVDAIIKEDSVKTEFELDSGCEVDVNVEQIQKVITHLVTNSMEAMPDDGTGRLKVAVSGCQISNRDGLPIKSGKYLHISLEDNGRGIAKENLGRVFDPYFTTKQNWNQKGLGLGLAICHSLIHSHDGIITVESGDAGGTTFHIYLPAAGKDRHRSKAFVA